MTKSNRFLQMCKKCKAACCKLGAPDFSEKEMKKVLKAGYKDYFIEASPGVYELKIKNGICPYLKKDYSCEIHNVKPLTCLCWPVFPKYLNEKRKYIIFYCPLTKHLSKKDIEKCEKEARKIPKNVVTTCWDKSALPKSEREIIMKRFSKFKYKDLK